MCGFSPRTAPDGNPSFSTVLKVLAALGLRVHVGPTQAAQAEFEGDDPPLDFNVPAVSDRRRRRVVQRGER